MCLCMCVSVCVCFCGSFIYFSGGENGLAQFLNSHWHMEKQSGGVWGRSLKIENRANGNA